MKTELTPIEREIVRLALHILKEDISGSLILSRKHRDTITELRLKLGPEELPSVALNIDGIIAKLEGERCNT